MVAARDDLWSRAHYARLVAVEQREQYPSKKVAEPDIFGIRM